MGNAVLAQLAPWLALLAGCFVVLHLLLRWGGGRGRWRRLATLHANQEGGVQSLSFVLTVPAFIMVMMLIVQVSQLMIGVVVVNYAAFAAARSAIVWIPSYLDEDGIEPENRIGFYAPGPSGIDGPGDSYVIEPRGGKHRKIAFAAQLACTPLAPSRDWGAASVDPERLAAVQRVYAALDPSYRTNGRVPRRIANKLAYSIEQTSVRITFLHKSDEPALIRWDLPRDRDEFYFNQLGWQDPIRVEVTHHMALLPGPGRLLARRTTSAGYDAVAAGIQQRSGLYTREITASVTLGNEGEMSVIRYRPRDRLNAAVGGANYGPGGDDPDDPSPANPGNFGSPSPSASPTPCCD